MTSSAPSADSRTLTVQMPFSLVATTTAPKWLWPIVNLISIVVSPIDARQHGTTMPLGPAIPQRKIIRPSSNSSSRMKATSRAQLKIALYTLGAWAAIALLFYCQRAYLVAAAWRTPVRDRLLLEVSIVWGSWALLTAVVLYIVRRIPLSGDRQWSLLLHIPVGIGVALLHSAMVAAITPLFLWRPAFAPMRDMFRGRIASAIAFDTVVYLLVAAVLYAILYAARSREREIAAA